MENKRTAKAIYETENVILVFPEFSCSVRYEEEIKDRMMLFTPKQTVSNKVD